MAIKFQNSATSTYFEFGVKTCGIDIFLNSLLLLLWSRKKGKGEKQKVREENFYT